MQDDMPYQPRNLDENVAGGKPQSTGAANMAQLLRAEHVVRDALTQAYGVAAVAKRGRRLVVLRGRALEIARAALTREGLPEEIAASFDVAGRPWCAVPADGTLQLWRKQGARDELVTELVAGDPPVRVLMAVDGWQLVCCVDGATGWAEPGVAFVEIAPPSGAETAFDEGAYRRVGVPLDSASFVARVREYLGVPYVWGGTTSEGIDCSGLVQRACWQAGGQWLARHSTALLRVGARVAPSAAASGDVLVLKRSRAAGDTGGDAFAAKHPMHVAVCVADGVVVHASRDARMVVEEPLASLRERYRVLSVRRLAPSVQAAL